MEFINKEIADIKDRLSRFVLCSEIVSCNRQLVQIKIVYDDLFICDNNYGDENNDFDSNT